MRSEKEETYIAAAAAAAAPRRCSNRCTPHRRSSGHPCGLRSRLTLCCRDDAALRLEARPLLFNVNVDSAQHRLARIDVADRFRNARDDVEV